MWITDSGHLQNVVAIKEDEINVIPTCYMDLLNLVLERAKSGDTDAESLLKNTAKTVIDQLPTPMLIEFLEALFEVANSE